MASYHYSEISEFLEKEYKGTRFNCTDHEFADKLLEEVKKEGMRVSRTEKDFDGFTLGFVVRGGLEDTQRPYKFHLILKLLIYDWEPFSASIESIHFRKMKGDKQPAQS